MCQRHGSNQNSHPPVLARTPLCNQFIHYHISSRRVFGINCFKLFNVAVVAIEYSFATVYIIYRNDIAGVYIVPSMKPHFCHLIIEWRAILRTRNMDIIIQRTFSNAFIHTKL